jgi:UDP-N-acetylmuramyl-tripeptide synthetase
MLKTVFPVTCHTKHVGPGSTFVAIDGFKVQGSSFIPEAIERGATKIVVNRDVQVPNHVELLVVDDCRKALAELSSAALGNPASKLKIIGITGTKGKTSTTFLIGHILGDKTALLGSVKNRIGQEEFDSELTTPESDYIHMFFDECVRRGIEYVIMEVSSHAIALQRVHGISFDCIGFTNLAPEHMDFHPTMEHYFETKCRIFSQLKPGGCIVINGDDAWGRRVALKNVITFGFEGTCGVVKNDITGLVIRVDEETFSIPAMFGLFNAYNVMMAILVCRCLGVKVIAERLLTFGGVPGRLQMHKLQNGAIAFVDYAHNPSSVEAVLKTLRSLSDHVIVVFGCGGNRDTTKRPVMGRLAAEYGDEVIVTDDNPRDEDREVIIDQIFQGISADVCSYRIPDRAQAIQKAVACSRAGSVIALLGKGHESYYLCKGVKYYFNDLEEIKKY